MSDDAGHILDLGDDGRGSRCNFTKTMQQLQIVYMQTNSALNGQGDASVANGGQTASVTATAKAGQNTTPANAANTTTTITVPALTPSHSPWEPPPPSVNTQHLPKQVHEILKLQPNIANYLRRPCGDSTITVEEVTFCHCLEHLTQMTGPFRSITTAEIEAMEGQMRALAHGTPMERGVLSTALAKDAGPLGMFCRAGIRSAPRDKKQAGFKVTVVNETLTSHRRSSYPMITPKDVDFSDVSLWRTEVQGRPDLTELKLHLLSKGGDRFLRNDILASDAWPNLVARLKAEGEMQDGSDVQLYPLKMRECHVNAMNLAGSDVVELWTGFALQGTVWVRHSWCVWKNHIVETTVLHDQYYGVHVPKPFFKLLCGVCARFGARYRIPYELD